MVFSTIKIYSILQLLQCLCKHMSKSQKESYSKKSSYLWRFHGKKKNILLFENILFSSIITYSSALPGIIGKNWLWNPNCHYSQYHHCSVYRDSIYGCVYLLQYPHKQKLFLPTSFIQFLPYIAGIFRKFRKTFMYFSNECERILKEEENMVRDFQFRLFAITTVNKLFIWFLYHLCYLYK